MDGARGGAVTALMASSMANVILVTSSRNEEHRQNRISKQEQPGMWFKRN
jgi:hypothetical protein